MGTSDIGIANLQHFGVSLVWESPGMHLDPKQHYRPWIVQYNKFTCIYMHTMQWLSKIEIWYA